MKHVSPEYQEQLERLARVLCPLTEVVEVNPLTIPRDDNRWDSEGCYFDRQSEHPTRQWDFED